MPDLKSIESVYLVLGFIVPGMITTLVRAQFLPGRVRTLSENVVTYIALTVLYYGLAAPVVEYVLSIREPGRAKIFAWLGLIILLPAAIGFGLGILGQNDVFRRILQYFKINPVHATPSASDYAFARLSGDHFVKPVRGHIVDMHKCQQHQRRARRITPYSRIAAQHTPAWLRTTLV